MIEMIATSPFARIAFLIGLFAVVAPLVFAASTIVMRRLAAQRSLDALSAESSTIRSTSGLRAQQNETAWARLANAIENSGLNLTDTKDVRLRSLLKEAGYHSPAAPRIYTLIRMITMFVLPAIFVLAALTREEPMGFWPIYIIGSLLGLMGLYLPNLFVRAKADRRREEIVNGFPDCLDLMLVCMEAGLGIEAAMDRVGREMVLSHPLVAHLLNVTVLQLRAGASRQDAFHTLGDTSGVDEIQSFATLLIQSDRLGTSVAATLRVYAAEMREKRRMRAEEKAYRLPVLISIPLVVFMLPTMIGVLMLPASIRMAREVFPMMTGG